VTTLGVTPATVAVAAEAADADPDVFDAVTTSLIVDPTSGEPTVYVAAVAPLISAQLAPLWSQRRHWYAYERGAVPVHVPTEPLSTCPSCAVPLIVGGAELAGGWAGGVTIAVGADGVDAEPAEFDAVTTATIANPSSALERV
jgi:hypothetical protein